MRGREEYILVFDHHVPSPLEERLLYNGAEIRGETLLTYPDLKTEVILTTLEADDEFREKHPETVLALETFRFDEIRIGKKKEFICIREEKRKHKIQ